MTETNLRRAAPTSLSRKLASFANEARHELKATSLAALSSVLFVAIPALYLMNVLVTDTRSHREIVDVNTFPWSSVGKIGNSAGGHCTAAVIGPSQFLTAAHCLYNKRAGRFVSAESTHILLGYAQGDYRVHRISSKYAVPPAFDPSTINGLTTAYATDWAILYINEPFPQDVRPLRMASATPSPGSAVKTVGFAREQLYLMTVDHHCQIQEISEDAKLIAHDCVINFGDSGGPLLSGDGRDEGLIVGVNGAVLKNDPQWGVAVSTAGITEFLASQVVGSNDKGKDRQG